MSKTKTLFTMALLVLLGSMGAAQAQNFAEVKLFTTPEDFAREGGKNEAAGSILLNSSAESRSPGRRCNDHAAFLRPPCGRYRRHNPMVSHLTSRWDTRDGNRRHAMPE